MQSRAALLQCGIPGAGAFDEFDPQSPWVPKTTLAKQGGAGSRGRGLLTSSILNSQSENNACQAGRRFCSAGSRVRGLLTSSILNPQSENNACKAGRRFCSAGSRVRGLLTSSILNPQHRKHACQAGRRLSRRRGAFDEFDPQSPAPQRRLPRRAALIPGAGGI